MSLKRRLERLEKTLLDSKASSIDPLEVVLDGFDDVRSWLESSGSTPDVHRVGDLIRMPQSVKSGTPEAEFVAEAMRYVVLGCIEKRFNEKTGENLLDDKERSSRRLIDYIQNDPVSYVWEYNSALFVECAHQGFCLEFRGERGSAIALRQVFPLTPECGDDCPLRPVGWTEERVKNNYPEWWEAFEQMESVKKVRSNH